MSTPESDSYEFAPREIVQAFCSEDPGEVATWLESLNLPNTVINYDGPMASLWVETTHDGEPVNLNVAGIGGYAVVTSDDEVHAVSKGLFELLYRKPTTP